MRKLQIVSELARRSKHGQSVADLHYRAKLHSLSSGPFWSADVCIQHARLVRLLPPLSGTRMERADMASIKVLQRQLDVFKYRLLLRVMQLWKVGVRSLTGSAASYDRLPSMLLLRLYVLSLCGGSIGGSSVCC